MAAQRPQVRPDTHELATLQAIFDVLEEIRDRLAQHVEPLSASSTAASRTRKVSR